MTNTYQPPTLTVDIVYFRYQDETLEVLLIQRQNEPFRGQRALPGGYNAQGETTWEAAARIMQKKTGVDVESLAYAEQLYTFDTVARDPRGHAISVSYMALNHHVSPEAGGQVENPQFYDVRQLPEMAFDHDSIIEYAMDRLKNKLNYTTVAQALLPEKFTLQELQSLYEAVYNQKLDKRNFRKKFLSLGVLEETKEKKTGPHRPALLYRFKDSRIKELERFT